MTFTIGGEEPALAPGSLVLVTGANSFVGSWVIDLLLSHGYKVQGTVRSKARCAWVSELFDGKYGAGSLELVEIPDLDAPGVVESLFTGPAGVVHVANVPIDSLTSGSGSVEPALAVTPVVKSSLKTLEAAVKSSTVRRFVYTSSSAAVYWADPLSKVPKVVTPHDFNLDSIFSAWAPPPYTPDRVVAVYGAQKAQSEHAMLKFMRQQSPDRTKLVLNIVNPDLILGAALMPQGASTTVAWKRAWEHRDLSELQFILGFGSRWMLDVKDVARLHLSALLDPQVRSERILGYAHPHNGRISRDELLRLQRERGLPEDMAGEVKGDFDCIDKIDDSRSLELLRRLGREGWVSREQTFREMLSS